jgi:hypothetical protein
MSAKGNVSRLNKNSQPTRMKIVAELLMIHMTGMQHAQPDGTSKQATKRFLGKLDPRRHLDACSAWSCSTGRAAGCGDRRKFVLHAIQNGRKCCPRAFRQGEAEVAQP